MNAGGVSARAHAKINLSLRITATRPDGYHDLHTVFQALALHDTITVVLRPGPFAIDCDTPGVPLDGSNLAWRAAEALWKALGRTGSLEGASVHILKRVPVQAGLGGGSTDAAATLRVLARLWDAAVTPAALMDVAAGLGADVPFFLAGGAALGLGRGDALHRLAGLPARDVVLVLPGFGVSTRAAYGWYDEAVAAGRVRYAQPRWPPAAAGATQASPLPVTVPWPPAPGELANDLQRPVVDHHPAIGEIADFLAAAGAETAAMSGSGSAVFGLFSSLDGARAAAGAARARGWRVLRSRTLDGREYDRRARPVAAARRTAAATRLCG
jgi:4-diphosphocytidyl-2-C-methyl-D-erythritol kinase